MIFVYLIFNKTKYYQKLNKKLKICTNIIKNNY